MFDPIQLEIVLIYHLDFRPLLPYAPFAEKQMLFNQKPRICFHHRLCVVKVYLMLILHFVFLTGIFCFYPLMLGMEANL